MSEVTVGVRVRVTMVHEGVVIKTEDDHFILRADDGSLWQYAPVTGKVTVEKIDD